MKNPKPSNESNGQDKSPQPVMACPSCGEKKWKNQDEHRIKPVGMCMCENCAMVSYPSKWRTEEEIKKHYRTSYRNPPNHNNVFAGERKNHFHLKFLEETFMKWRQDGKTKPKILEIGSAFGMTLNWIKKVFPEAEVYGTELTTSFRRNAYHEFGLKLTEDMDESIKYDLIISYKVLEHQLDPALQLARYQKCLEWDGLLYISVPTWFGPLNNFGLNGFDLEYYYDPNHINVWTKKTFENIVERSGFVKVKEDHVMYSNTYMYKPNEDMKKTPLHKEDPKHIEHILKTIKAAFLACTENNFKKALEIYPNYPQAHASLAEMSRKELASHGWDYFKTTYLDKAEAECPESVECVIMGADFAMRAGKFQLAIKYCERALKMKPENPGSLHQLAMCFRELGIRSTDGRERVHNFQQAQEVCQHMRMVSSQHFKEATDLLYFFNSKIPFDGEKQVSLLESPEERVPEKVMELEVPRLVSVAPEAQL